MDSKTFINLVGSPCKNKQSSSVKTKTANSLFETFYKLF